MIKFMKMIVVAIGVIVTFATTSPAYAQRTTGNGTASVKILRSITVTKSTDLYFGKIVPSTAASTVTIAESGARTCGSGLSCYDTATSGSFVVNGTSGEVVSVALDSNTTTLSDGGSNAMTVNLATSTTVLPLTGGTGNFKVGGTLNVGANQKDGSYTGQYSVSVNYQ